jgi:hypothetical protein
VHLEPAISSGASRAPDGTTGAAAVNLDTPRYAWLNRSDCVDRVPEVVPGYPDRIVAKPGHEAELEKRTATNLCNAMRTWLANLHRDLDQSVAKAYGWDDHTPAMPDEGILRRLLELNPKRAAAQRNQASDDCSID